MTGPQRDGWRSRWCMDCGMEVRSVPGTAGAAQPCPFCGGTGWRDEACSACGMSDLPLKDPGVQRLCPYCAELSSLKQGTYPASACWRCRELVPGPHICPAAPAGTRLPLPASQHKPVSRDRLRWLKLATLLSLIGAAVVSADVRPLAWIAPVLIFGVLALACSWERS